MSKESKLMKNTAIIAVGNLCTKCISFFMIPLYTALLSTKEFGTVDLITTYSSLLIVPMTLQFEQGVFRFLIDARGRFEEQKKYISTAVVALIFLNTVFAVTVGTVLAFIGYKYNLYLIIMVISGVFYGLLVQIPRGLGDNTTYAIASCLNGSLHVVLNVLFIAILSMGPEGMLLATVFSNVIASIFIFIRSRLHTYFNVKYIRKNVFIELAKYSFPLIPYTMCWWVINASDRTIINIVLGTAENGIYAVAYKFPSLFSMISNIFQLAWTESAAESVTDTERDKYYNTTLNRTIKFYSSCNIGIIAVMPFMFSVLIKENFASAYFYVPILMTAALFHSIAALYGSIYFAFKETKKIAYTTGLSAIINIGVNVIFIRWIGLYAAAISSVCAYLVIILIRVADLKKFVNIKVNKIYLTEELLVYIIVFSAYYAGNNIIRATVLVCLIPYCFLQNRETLIGLLSVLKKKMRGGKSE